MKKFLISVWIFGVTVFCVNGFNYANVDFVEKINIDIVIKNFDAEITEVWDIDTGYETELYQFLENTFIDDIYEFEVLENGEKFEYVEPWKIFEYRDEKDRKCGINQTEDGIELCFGVGYSGYHRFIIKYKIKDFIKNNECRFKLFDSSFPEIKSLDICLTGNFKENCFTKLKNNIGNVVLIKDKAVYKVANSSDDIEIYLNFDGVDNSNCNNKVIKIINKSNYRIIKLMRFLIVVFILCIFIIIILIKKINFNKYKRLEFRPF